MPELVFFRRGEEVLRFALDRPRTVLGRGDGSDVVLPDPEVSRAQAALRYDGKAVTLEDLSGKGTQVGGQSVGEAVLQDGADIVLGQWRAIFRERSGGAASGTTESGDTRTELQPQDASARRPQPVQLRVRQGTNETTHKLSADAFTVGKDPGNDLVVDDRFTSGRHLKLTRRDGAFLVVDAGSTNGTFVGNVRIYEAEVTPPVTLRIGETELVLEPVPGKRSAPFEGILGKDPAIQHLIDIIERVAPSSAAVAIFGETGTGKELVAHALHARSNRADKPFIPVNCAAISKELIESELFGHERGAFTGAATARKGAFEEADGGTLFLDEIGELSLELQSKLLRALESGEIKRVGAGRPSTVDVRVVTATNRDLLAAAREGEFREDLYYRLCVIPLHLPPLRSRRGDVKALAESFLRTYAPPGQDVSFTPAALARLQAHHWPGNVRELRNVVHRALLLRQGPTLDEADLSFDQRLHPELGISVPEVPPGMTLEQMLEKLERQIVEAALKRYRNNRERVSKELGVARSTLFKRLKDWGLTQKDETE